MLRDAVEATCVSASQLLADLLDLVRLSIQRSADDEEDALRITFVGLLPQSLTRWLSEDHLIHRRILIKADFCHPNSPFMTFARRGSSVIPRRHSPDASFGACVQNRAERFPVTATPPL